MSKLNSRNAWVLAGVALCVLPLAALGAAEQAPPSGKVAIPPDARWPFRTAPAGKPKEAAPGGIGLVLEAKADGVYAQQLVPGGPAMRAGVQVGDRIVRVDAWVAPTGVKVPDIAEHIRGAPGTTAELGLKRGEADVVLQVTRMALTRLFPETAKEVLVVRAGLAIVATGGQHSVGVRFLNDGKLGQLQQYAWAVAKADQPLGGAGSQLGQGAVVVDSTGGGTIQVADWKLELRAQPDGTLLVAQSNLGLYEVPGDWLALAPPWPSVVKPRAAATKKSARWFGPGKLRFQLQSAGKPVAGMRVTLRLADAAAVVQESVTQLSDLQGRIELPVPKGLFRVHNLVASVGGKGLDAFFAYELVPSADQPVATDATAAAVLEVKPRQGGPVQPLDWTTDPRIGQGLPLLDVARWFHFDKPPATLAGKVLLVDVWATWCGPCKATAPAVAELHARLGSKGLVTVAASIDKDEAALEAYAKEQMPGAPPIAWVGTDAMEVLDAESVPTFIVVDGQGRIRGVHKGTGWNLESLQPFLEGLLAEGKKK